MESSQGLGVESPLCPEGIQEDVGGARREGGTGGEAVVGGEPHKSPGTEREKGGD